MPETTICWDADELAGPAAPKSFAIAAAFR